MNKQNSAISVAKALRVTPRKLNLLVGLIRKLKVSEAMLQLRFSNRRAAKLVLDCLQSAVANAENNFGLDIDRLFVSSATVGKGLVMKRMMPRARGRAARIKKSFSNLYIVVSEEEGKNGTKG